MDRYHTITLLDIEKAFDKSQHPSMIKKNTPERLGMDAIYLNIIESVYNKPIVNTILNG